MGKEMSSPWSKRYKILICGIYGWETQNMLSLQNEIDVHNRKIKTKSKISKTDPKFCISGWVIPWSDLWVNIWVSTLTTEDISCMHKNLDATVGGSQVERRENLTFHISLSCLCKFRTQLFLISKIHVKFQILKQRDVLLSQKRLSTWFIRLYRMILF